jgi:hypothetical protein
MTNRRTPLLLKHGQAPDARHFAILAGLEACVRGLLVAVMPLAVYRAFGDAETVSHVYLVVGIIALFWGLMVPWATQKVPRRWMYTLGCLFYMVAMMLAASGGAVPMALALGLMSMATVTNFVCLNAYILDYVARNDLARSESLKMFFAATPWTVGPVTGVWLLNLWPPAPFLAGAVASVLILAVFWYLRLGNGKAITRARGPAVNPLAYLGRFFAQPRLIAGWLFAVLRSCGWWVYVVYLPIFAVQSGLGDQIGGIAMSASNALLFVAPLIRRIVQRLSVRRVIRVGFAAAGVMMIAATVFSGLPWLAVLILFGASVFLITLDVCAGLPFLMAVRPAERTEMAAVYSSFRDVSGILTPGVAAVVLLAAPVSAVFAACGAGLFIGWGMAGTLHPRLGQTRSPAAARRQPG